MIVVVLGSTDRKMRDAKTRELLTKGLLDLAAARAQPPSAAAAPPGKAR